MRILSRIIPGTLVLLLLAAAALFYLLPANDCEIVVYSTPQELVLARDYAWLSDSTAKRLLIFSLADNRLAANIALPAPAKELAVSADGTKVMLLSSQGVLVVDGAGKKFERKVDVAGDPSGLAISADGKAFYTVLRSTHKLAMFDLAGGKAVADAAFDCKTCQLMLSPDGKSLVAAGEHGITTFDAQNLAAIKHYENKGQGLPFAISPDGKTLAYTFDSAGTGAGFLDLAGGTIEQRATMGAVGYLAFSADGSSLIASDLMQPGQGSGNLSIMPVHIPEEVKGAIVSSIPPDRSTSITMDQSPHALAVDAKRGRIDVVAISPQGAMSIEVLDAATRKVTGVMPLPDAKSDWDRFLAWRKGMLKHKDAGRCG